MIVEHRLSFQAEGSTKAAMEEAAMKRMQGYFGEAATEVEVSITVSGSIRSTYGTDVTWLGDVCCVWQPREG